MRTHQRPAGVLPRTCTQRSLYMHVWPYQTLYTYQARVITGQDICGQKKPNQARQYYPGGGIHIGSKSKHQNLTPIFILALTLHPLSA